jgi:SSS family transporter
MPTLSPVDLAIVAVYILGMTLFGLWFSKSQKDLKTYFVGERNVGWFMVLVSIVATETSAVTFLSVPGTAFNPGDPAKNLPGGNMTFLQLALGYIVGRIVVAWVLLPMYMRGELFSAYQVLREKFGPGVQRVASALFLVTRTIADGLRLYLTALVMQYVGWGIEVAVVVVGVVTIVYTYLGGMKAVLWTDLIQFVIKITGAALAGVFVLRIIPGGWETFTAVGLEKGKFVWINPSLDPTNAYTLLAGLIGGAVFSMASHGADQLMVQRYLCARSLAHARTALVLSGFTVFAQFVLFLLVGVGMFVAREQGEFDTTVLENGVRRPATKDEVFGLFIVTKMPVGVVGVLVAAILAAAMSTLSSSLNSSANAVVSDFLKPLMPAVPEPGWVLTSRVLTAVFGVAQIVVALVAHWSGSDRSIVDRVLAVAGITTGLVLGLFLLGRLRRRIPSVAAIVGLVCGFVAVMGVWLPAQFGTAILAWPWFALVGSVTTVGVAILLSLFLPTRPDGPAATPANRSPQPGV